MAEEIHSLVKAMQEMKENKGDSTYANSFVKELMFTKFYMPVNITPPLDENGVAKAGTKISYISINNKNDGKNLLIAFTSNDEYNKFFTKEKSTYIMMHPYDEVKQLVSSKDFDGFVIDPAGENVAVTKELIAKIEQSRPSMVVKTEKVTAPEGQAPLLPAQNINNEFAARLKKFFEEEQEGVTRCWLMQTKRPQEAMPTLVLVLDFEGSQQATFDKVAQAMRSNIRVNDTIGMMSVKDSVAAAAVEGVEAFFEA
ncbi:MAG: SseB family protein [Firmicutes bacterium]|nr:SseB family protein [Bacillota bacterium]